MAHVPSFAFSIDWLHDGRLLATSGASLLRQNADGSVVQHADMSALPGPYWNEIVVDGRGNTYVNGIGFDLMAGEAVKPGSIALITPDGMPRQVADGMAFPNGMLVTPDNSTLVVAESYARRLTAFDIANDGSLSNRRVWADLIDGVPDGICIDTDGAIWYADVPNQRCVRVYEGGRVERIVNVDRGCFACMLGGADGRTLFIMAAQWQGAAAMANAPQTGRLLTIQAPAPHAGWP
jgi:sugar lactone lactonase YvrE